MLTYSTFQLLYFTRRLGNIFLLELELVEILGQASEDNYHRHKYTLAGWEDHRPQ